MNLCLAPFSPVEVQRLNERQVRVDGDLPIHPLTCPNRGQVIAFGIAGGMVDYSHAISVADTEEKEAA